MAGVLACLTGQSRFVVDTLIYYALFAIVALSLSFMYRRAGVPFLGCSVPVLTGGLVVSAVTTRLAFAVAGAGGIELLPYLSENDWVYNSEENVALVNGFLGERPLLCVALVAFTFAASMCLGAAPGWLVARPALGMDPRYLMIVTVTLPDMAAWIAIHVVPLSGGTMGVFVPDLLAFTGDKSNAVLALSLLAMFGVYAALRAVGRSPLGRVMAAVRDGPETAASVGVDVARVRGRVVLIGSGMMALVGSLLSFYFTFVVQANYHNALWSNWPLLMVVVDGSGGDAGVFLGVAVIDGLRRLIILNKDALIDTLFFPIAYLERLIYSVLLLAFLMLRPRALTGAKPMPSTLHKRVIEEMSEEPAPE
ncbi:branched-chain amino acid ABC transporter permease [Candidatus Bathyarchaeota archaeon]|nr:branched-chain amino acid ABC transporter permease [Candidatus Bathyarchaeota archaeon]